MAFVDRSRTSSVPSWGPKPRPPRSTFGAWGTSSKLDAQAREVRRKLGWLVVVKVGKSETKR